MLNTSLTSACAFSVTLEFFIVYPMVIVDVLPRHKNVLTNSLSIKNVKIHNLICKWKIRYRWEMCHTKTTSLTLFPIKEKFY